MFFASKFTEFFPEEFFIHGFPSVRIRYGNSQHDARGFRDANIGTSTSPHYTKYPGCDDHDICENYNDYARRGNIFPRQRKKYPTGLTIEEVLPEEDDEKIEEIIVKPSLRTSLRTNSRTSL